MDVMNSNASNSSNRNNVKNTIFKAKIKRFSIEIYFMWFSALIFVTETFVGEYLDGDLDEIPLFNLKTDDANKEQQAFCLCLHFFIA